MSCWGPEGPPPEAYSRVTDPERFRPLHPAALALLRRLGEDFGVERVEGYGLDPELEKGDIARPSIRLVPRDAGAAPVIVAFTAFPGLVVRCGLAYREAFPGCGCDACDETAGEEIARLEELLEDVTAGRFRETIRLPCFGRASQEWERWAPEGRSSRGALRIERARARELSGARRRLSVSWKPWPQLS